MLRVWSTALWTLGRSPVQLNGRMLRARRAAAPHWCCMSTSAAAATAHSDDYQYMQRSKLPTFYFQRSLPRLPIPLLERTCERFLAAVQPIQSAHDYEQTQRAVAEFRHGVGAQLHTLLQQSDKANKHTSYISEPWFDMYLSDRAPLPLNYNPLLVMRSDSRPAYQAQLVRAANLVVSSLRFWRSLCAELLEPEVYHLNPRKSDTAQFRRWIRLTPQVIATYVAYAFKAFPLDMSQYNRLFGVSRIPELGKDRLVQHTDSRHILVLRRGNMYAVDVLDANGNIAMPKEILGSLEVVLQLDAQRPPAAVPLGVLTGSERDEWARVRQHLLTCSAHNKHLLEQQVDAALFCLCLDTADEPVFNEQNPVPVLKHLLASDGTNRWFDKSVSLLVSADGTAAVNFEHSWGDGVAVLRYFNEIYKETTERPFVKPDTVPTRSQSAVRVLDFDTDSPALQEAVAQAKHKNAQVLEALNMHMLRFGGLSKKTCKSDRVSPDAIMQLSFQLAYRRAYNDYVGTYESCSTAAFRHGRTETMRPCTMATKEFCEAVLQSEKSRPSMAQLRAMIDRCSTLHGKLTKEAAMGQGFDRHLFALKNMAVKHDIAVPALYQTEAYRKINYNIISTSTLSSNALLAGAFGPVVPDGLGVGYGMYDDECGAVVTSYEQKRDGKVFVENLQAALEDIRCVLAANRK